MSFTYNKKEEPYTPLLFILKIFYLEWQGLSAAEHFRHLITQHIYAQLKLQDSVTGIWQDPDLSINMRERVCLCFSTGF